MKPISLSCTLILSLALALPLAAAQKPQDVLSAISKLRSERIQSARDAGKPVAASLYQADVLALAKDGVKGVDPAKVDLADAAAWQELFMAAEDYAGARTVAERWAGSAEDADKFKAQMALVTAQSRLKDYAGLRRTLVESKPTAATNRIRLATLANTYTVNILTNEGRAPALEVLSAGERILPTDGFADDRQRDLAKRTRENLAATRKAIEDNAGNDTAAAAAIEKNRRAMLAQVLGGARGGTNAAAAAAASRAERDAKLAKLNGTTAPDFKANQAIGSFNSLGDLKGKVVMLDFFAHWCGPCIASFPSVRELYDELNPKGLEVVGVTKYYGYYKTENRTGKDMPPAKELERMKEFATEKKMNWPVAFVDQKVFTDYQASAIPHVVLIDRTGKIRKVKVGFNKDGAKAFHDEVAKIIAE